MSDEKPTNCQWCGAEVWPKYSARGRTMFKCFTTHEPSGGGSISTTCRDRCTDQMAKLRAVTVADVTLEQLRAWQEMIFEGDANEDQKSIVAAVKVMIGGVR